MLLVRVSYTATESRLEHVAVFLNPRPTLNTTVFNTQRLLVLGEEVLWDLLAGGFLFGFHSVISTTLSFRGGGGWMLTSAVGTFGEVY